MNNGKSKIIMGMILLLLAAALIIMLGSRLKITKPSASSSSSEASLPTSSAYPEMTYDANNKVKIASPTVDAAADRDQNSGTDLQYGSAVSFVEDAAPQQTITDYLSKSGVVSVTNDGVWSDTDLSLHTDINDKFQNLHTIQTIGVYQKNISYGETSYVKGHQGTVIAYVTYDGTTSTIHSLFVDSISFIADGFVDEGMSGYMFG